MSSSSVIFYSAVLPRNATVSERNGSWLAISQRAPSGVCDEYRYRHGKHRFLGFTYSALSRRVYSLHIASAIMFMAMNRYRCVLWGMLPVLAIARWAISVRSSASAWGSTSRSLPAAHASKYTPWGL